MRNLLSQHHHDHVLRTCSKIPGGCFAADVALAPLSPSLLGKVIIVQFNGFLLDRVFAADAGR